MSQQQVGIVDYGMGNLWSLKSAFNNLGAKAAPVSEPDKIGDFHHLILPGVGSFNRASRRLHESGLAEALKEQARIGKTVLLGICLGMQLLGTGSTEDGWSPGLGMLPNETDRFQASEVCGRSIPHIGFDRTHFPDGNYGLFAGLRNPTDFYYVHAYRMAPTNESGGTAICHYGSPFLAGFDMGSICGTQFHPEKSQVQGLRLLRNFLERSL